MNILLKAPTQIEHEVALPASKSLSNRALLLNALSPRPAKLTGLAQCDDTNAMAQALDTISAPGNDPATPLSLNTGAAGTAMRFLTAYLATQQGHAYLLDGSPRMRQRPIAPLVEALRQCGADITYTGKEGYPPLLIRGRQLSATGITIAGDTSSQYISALLMIAPRISGCRTITITGDILSRPYINMTLGLMRQYGVTATLTDHTVTLPENSQYTAPDTLDIEADWSAAAYWLQLQALLPKSRITLTGLQPTGSLQGDSAALQLFHTFGVRATTCGRYLDLRTEPADSSPIETDLSDNPDLAQSVIVTACLTGRHFHITGLSTLRIKETDRVEALRAQLLKLGYELTIGHDNSLSWTGQRTGATKRPAIDTYDDHRMAMAFAPAAIAAPLLRINDATVVTKSYPDFWSQLMQAGFAIIQDIMP